MDSSAKSEKKRCLNASALVAGIEHIAIAVGCIGYLAGHSAGPPPPLVIGLIFVSLCAAIFWAVAATEDV